MPYSDKVEEARKAAYEKVRQEFTKEDLLRNVGHLGTGLTGPELYDMYVLCFMYLMKLQGKA